jgi:hypothetical protein
MKCLSICALAVLFSAAFASMAAAEAPAAVGSQTLSAMGLGGMEKMSDEAGLKVRGKGTFAGVWGGSSASYKGQSATNNYEAGSNWNHKSSFANGGSLSFAGKAQAQFGADPTGAALSISAKGGFAGGGAFAFAK